MREALEDAKSVEVWVPALYRRAMPVRSTSTPPRPSPLRVGVDTGGTFTDFVLEGPEGLTLGKRPSTPTDPAVAVLAGLEALAQPGRSLDVRHGTTVGTNAVLTRQGARVVFVVTAGFADLLHIGDGTRSDLHTLAPARNAPLVSREACVEIDERMGPDGSVIKAPTAASLKQLARQVRALQADAVVICLLHATHYPAHERIVAKALDGTAGVIRTSAGVCAEPYEVARAETAVLDAFVTPVMQQYLARLTETLGRRGLSVMRSDGGRMSASAAGEQAIRTLLSGPAAGVAAARIVAARHGVARALTFDVGGTSTDVAFLEGAEAATRGVVRLGPHTASLPGLAIETLGAGGGSILSIDAGGALRVGPQSAGAQPGPACYGKGGPLCLSDAWLLLGHIPDTLLGGEFALDLAASKRAAADLARTAGCSVNTLCEGILDVAAAATARALRRVTTREGHVIEGAALIAFGGGGPSLACRAAQHLGLTRVLVPPAPGIVAAKGALFAPWRADASVAAPARLTQARERALLAGLDKKVRAALRGQGRGEITLVAEVDARYAGQSFEVCVSARDWRVRVHEAHAKVHGFARPDASVEAVRFRVRGEAQAEGVTMARLPLPKRTRTRRPRRDAGGVAVLDRDSLEAGDRVLGPARLDEVTSTTWVAAGWQVDVLADGCLDLRVRGAAPAPAPAKRGRR